MSLKSIRALNLPFLGTVYLYIDRNDFLTDVQVRVLNRLKLALKIRESDKITWGGENLISLELRCFKEISEEIDHGDYVVKIDSDVLFTSGGIFFRVLKSDMDAIGQASKFWAPCVYFQGGCYFIRSALLPKLSFGWELPTRLLLRDLNTIMIKKGYKALTECPEDGAIFYIIRTKTNNIGFMEYHGRWDDLFRFNKKINLIHFTQRKKDMLKLQGLESIITKPQYIRVPLLWLLIKLPQAITIRIKKYMVA